MMPRYIVDGKRSVCPRAFLGKCYQGVIVAAPRPVDPDKPWDTLQCEKCGQYFDRLEIDSSKLVEWVPA